VNFAASVAKLDASWSLETTTWASPEFFTEMVCVALVPIWMPPKSKLVSPVSFPRSLPTPPP
jgi:hypothetical protein